MVPRSTDHPELAVADGLGSVADQLARENLPRIQRLAGVAFLLALVHVVVFGIGPDAPQGEVVERWRAALVQAHAVLAMAACGLGIGAWALSRHGTPMWAVRTWAVLTFVVAMGIVVRIVAVDQWITPSTSPFLVACVLAGMAVLQPPGTSGLLFALSYGAYHLAISQTQANPQQLTSNLVNGLSACALGWLIGQMSWRKTVENLRLSRQLGTLATRDALTGLVNRGEVVRLASEELARARRHGRPTSLLVLDLDHFKRVNDELGHPAGDALLRQVAAALEAGVRQTDIVARLGGEEFMVVLLHTDAAAALQVAEDLRRRLAQTVFMLGGATRRVSASIGVASTDALGRLDFETLYQRADEALYLAKASGRNRCATTAKPPEPAVTTP